MNNIMASLFLFNNLRVAGAGLIDWGLHTAVAKGVLIYNSKKFDEEIQSIF
jgi:hypothetical protein